MNCCSHLFFAYKKEKIKKKVIFFDFRLNLS